MYTRMTPTIGRLELAQTEGKVLGENRTRLGRREGRAPEMTDLDGEVTLRPDPSKRLPPYIHTSTSSFKPSKLPCAYLAALPII